MSTDNTTTPPVGHVKPGGGGRSATTVRPAHTHTNAPQIGGGHLSMAKAAAAGGPQRRRELWDVTGVAPKWAPPPAIRAAGKKTVAASNVALALECARATAGGGRGVARARREKQKRTSCKMFVTVWFHLYTLSLDGSPSRTKPPPHLGLEHVLSRLNPQIYHPVTRTLVPEPSPPNPKP